MTWPAIVLWIGMLVGLLSEKPILLYVGAVAGCFGTLQMLPDELVGGTNFLPSSVYAMLLVIKILFRHRPSDVIQVATDPTRLGFLFVFYIWCLFSAFVMPRLFAGQVDVIPVGLQVPWPVPLQPTVANLTQPAYLTISIFSALAAYFAASNPAFIKHWLQASALGGLALIATGLADLFLSAAGQSGLLEPFRNATYSLMTDVEVLNSKRVVGLMPEASAYGGVCVGALTNLTFLRPCFEPLWRDKIVPGIIIGLIMMALLSTSSAAYFGLAITGILYGVNWMRRRRSPSALVRTGLWMEAAVLAAAGLALLIVLAFQPQVLDVAFALVDQIIFQKSNSDSYEERSMWTRVGLEAFYKTYGLGVGFGGARTSNWFVAELSNGGIVGSAALCLFIFSVFLRSNVKSPELRTALRLSFIPNYFIWGVSATSADLHDGLNYGIIARLIDPIRGDRNS